MIDTILKVLVGLIGCMGFLSFFGFLGCLYEKIRYKNVANLHDIGVGEKVFEGFILVFIIFIILLFVYMILFTAYILGNWIWSLI